MIKNIYCILDNKYLEYQKKQIMADNETLEVLVEESLLKLSVAKLMFICNFLDMDETFYME